MERLNPNSRSDLFGSKLNRDHSTVLVYGVPLLTIVLGSLTPMLPVLTPAPLLPPMGYLVMLAWRLLRPGLLPLWAGVPLGLFDDLYSGQLLGSGIMLFSLTLIALDLLEIRFPWRGFWQDWLVAALFVTAYLVLALPLSGVALNFVQLALIGPQLLFAIVMFPLLFRIIALLDRFRLLRVRRIG